jgi:hypothetical protein
VRRRTVVRLQGQEDVWWPGQDQGVDQAADLGDGQGDQIVVVLGGHGCGDGGQDGQSQHGHRVPMRQPFDDELSQVVAEATAPIVALSTTDNDRAVAAYAHSERDTQRSATAVLMWERLSR